MTARQSSMILVFHMKVLLPMLQTIQVFDLLAKAMPHLAAEQQDRGLELQRKNAI